MIRPAMYDFFVFFQTKMVGRIRIYHEIKLEIDGNSWDIHIYIYIIPFPVLDPDFSFNFHT